MDYSKKDDDADAEKVVKQDNTESKARRSSGQLPKVSSATTTTTIDPKAVGFYVYAFVAISCCSGVVYGWPSLRRQLTSVEGTELDEKQLGIVFTCGAWSNMVAQFFLGLARDRWLGTKWTAVTGLFLCTVGFLGIALAGPNDFLILCASLLLLGTGIGVQSSLQPVTALFHESIHATLMASLTGAFMVSGLVFLLLTTATTNRRRAFASLAGVLIFLTLLAVWILPRGNFVKATKEEIVVDDVETRTTTKHTTTTAEQESTKPAVEDETDCREKQDQSFEEKKPSGEKNADQEVHESIAENYTKIHATAYEQLVSLEHILLLTWLSCLVIPLNYYIAIIGYLLEERGDVDGKYTGIFNVVYACSAAAAPLMGNIADSVGLGTAQALATILTACSFFVLAVVDYTSLSAQVVGMLLYSLGRLAVFAYYFTNVGKRFGYRHYGTLLGLGFLVSGILSLLQYPIIALASDGYDFEVNLGCGMACLTLLPYCFWLSRHEEKRRV